MEWLLSGFKEALLHSLNLQHIINSDGSMAGLLPLHNLHKPINVHFRAAHLLQTQVRRIALSGLIASLPVSAAVA